MTAPVIPSKNAFLTFNRGSPIMLAIASVQGRHCEGKMEKLQIPLTSDLSISSLSVPERTHKSFSSADQIFISSNRRLDQIFEDPFRHLSISTTSFVDARLLKFRRRKIYSPEESLAIDQNMKKDDVSPSEESRQNMCLKRTSSSQSGIPVSKNSQLLASL